MKSQKCATSFLNWRSFFLTVFVSYVIIAAIDSDAARFGSLPFSRLADCILEQVPTTGSRH